MLRAVKSHLIEIDGPQVQSKRSTYILICCCLLHSISLSLNWLTRRTVPDTGMGLELNWKLPGSQLWEGSHLDWRIHILNICTTADPSVGTLGMGQTCKSQGIALSFSRGCSALGWDCSVSHTPWLLQRREVLKASWASSFLCLDGLKTMNFVSERGNYCCFTNCRYLKLCWALVSHQILFPEHRSATQCWCARY